MMSKNRDPDDRYSKIVHQFSKTYNPGTGDEVIIKAILPNFIFLVLQDKNGVVNVRLTPGEAREIAGELSRGARELEERETSQTQRKDG